MSFSIVAIIFAIAANHAMADESNPNVDSFAQEIVAAIDADSLVWASRSLNVSYQVTSVDDRRAKEVAEYTHKSLVETFGAVGIAITEAVQDANISIVITDAPSTYPLSTLSLRSCSFKLDAADGKIIHAEATLVLGFASRECVRVLALRIAGLSGAAIHNVRGTLLSQDLVSDRLTEIDQSLLSLTYADRALKESKQALNLSMHIAKGSTGQALRWSKAIQAALDAQSIADQKKYTYSAFEAANSSEPNDFYRLGVTFLWLSVLDSRAGQLNEAIKNATASLELLQKDSSPQDQSRLYGIEVNLMKYHALNGNQAYCDAKRNDIKHIPDSVGNVVRATAQYALSLCDFVGRDLSAALNEISASMQACLAAYFGACPSWEVSYVFGEVRAARGELEEALQMHIAAKHALQDFAPDVSACSDLQHIRQRIARLSHQAGKSNESRAMAVEALGDRACYQSLSRDAISELRQLTQE